jgi:NAD(P)-dependent dehydrogenase (short-subunit alcohol dehydrogenase family)
MAADARFRLDGKVALVTGGSRGLGRAMVEGFAQAGADVAIVARHLEPCKELADEVTRTTDRRAEPYACHVGHWAELERLVEEVYRCFGRVDVLVNNAGISPRYGRVEDVSEELFDKVVGVNLKGPFRLTALVGSRMAANGGGSIINISSTGAVRPRADIVPYAAAKAGLNAITVAFAHAFGPKVRCNAIMAGTFLTDVSKAWDPVVFSKRAETFALKRGGRPDEVVGAALYLATDASTFTTGAILTIDGGQP